MSENTPGADNPPRRPAPSDAAGAYLRAVIDTDPNLIFAKDRNGRFTLANRAVAELYGTTPDALVGRTDADFHPDGSAVDAFLRDDRAVIDSGEPRLIEERIVDATGATRWFQTRKVALVAPDGTRQVLGVSVDITQRRELELELLHRAAQSEAVLDAVPALAFLKDADSVYLAANRTFASFAGVSQAEIPGRTDLDFFPRELAEQYRADDREVVRTGVPKLGIEETITGPDGELVRLSTSKAPIRDAQGRVVGVAGIALDVTAQHLAQHARQRAAERVARLQAVTAALAGTTTLEETARAIVDEGVAGLGASGGSFVRPSGDGKQLEMVYSRGYAEPVRTAWRRYPIDVAYPTGAALRTGEPLFLESRAEAMTRFPALASAGVEEEIQGWIVAPLRAGEETVGVLTFRFTGEPTRWDQEDRTFISALADQGALALERARLFEAERAARQRFELLARAGALLATSLDPRVTLEELAEAVVPAVADWCFVEMPNDQGLIEPVAVRHSDPELVEFAHQVLQRYPVDPAAEFGTARVLRTGEPDYVPDISPEFLDAVARDADHLEALRRVGFRSSISVPLSVRGRSIGVLSLVMAESGRRFAPEDVPFALELARRAAAALDNARLFTAEQAARREAERAARRAQRLSDIAAALNQSVTPEQVAEVCVGQAMEALGASAGSLALLSEDGQQFTIIHMLGYSPPSIQKWAHFPVTSGRPLSDSILRREPVLVRTREEWTRRYAATVPDAVGERLVAFSATPMIVGDRVVAGLALSFPDERDFEPADLTFLATVGGLGAQALERARLLSTERRARTEAEEANRAKSDFLSAMSHELRTPLNAIAGYVDLISLGVYGPVTAEQHGALRRVDRAQSVLLSLINDVLNFARLEAGRLEIQQVDVSVAEVLAELEPLVEPQVRARGLNYRCDPVDSRVTAVGDAERIRQVLLNLVGNAVKFTEPGGRVTVSVEAEADRVRIHVADTGHGIPADRLDTIFEPFVQIDRRRSEESQQGVGLGLAISRELAHAMGGELGVRSEVGRGSTFTLTLRAAAQA